jgi:hypothetical protein
MSANLERLIASMKERRDPQTWITRENDISRFIAQLPASERVLCRGEVRTEDRDYPAALVYRSCDDEVVAYAANPAPDGGMWPYAASRFWSNIPHAAIAREVLSGPETRVVIASADTHPKGQDAKQGLAGTVSGAVPKGDAQND